MTRLFFLFVMPAMLCCQKAARAQPDLPRVFHLTEKDGLGSRFDLSLVEDKKRGLIWIGSHSGIWRYDGETFVKVHPHIVKGRLSAESYLSTRLYLADSKGDVWFYDNRRCLKRLSHITGQIETFYVRSEGRDSAISCKPLFYIGGMHEDRKGRIWANTDSHGLVLFDPQNSCFVPARMSAKLEPSGHTAKIYEDAEGWFWFAHNLRPVRYNPETGEVWYQKNNPKKWPIFDLYSSVFFIDSRQTMWLAEFGENGYRYDLKTHQFEKLHELYLASGFVEDSLGRIWFGRYYNKTLTCYDPSDKRFQQYASNRDDPYSLHIGQWVASVHLDIRGNLWALDIESINVFDPKKKQPFLIFKDDLKQGPQSLPLGEVSDVFPASDGRYYVSYWMQDGGIVVLDSNFQVLEKWFWNEQQSVHHLAFWNSIEDNEGNIWMARQNGWFHIYNIISRRHQTLYCPEFRGSSTHIAIKDRQGNLWWGLWGEGIVKWDCRTRKFTNYPVMPANHDLVYNIIEGESDLFWLSTGKGIIKFDHRTGKCLGNFLPPVTDSLHHFREVVHGLVKINDSTLIGGSIAGITEFNMRTGRFRLIRFKDFESVPRASSDMVMDANGYIYYGYVGGMVRFHPHKRELTIIPLAELVGFPFQPRFFPHPLPGGRLAFGANDRFLTLDIAALENETPLAMPKLSLFSVDGDASVLGRDIENSIRLRHNENYFTLYFSSFALPDLSVFYTYRLKGLKGEWSQPSPTPFARFTNVPPGSYVFEVRAQLANGDSTEAASFQIYIHPPFWQTWWFRLLVLATTFALIHFFFRYRLRQRLEKEAIRRRIARDLHDEVGSTLTTISILSESVLRQMDLDGEKTRLGGIGEKARTAMSSMSDIVWSVNPQNDNMDKIVERMIRFAAETLEPLGISAIFDIEKEVYALQLPMEQRKDFYLFFKEATTNVAKHSGANRAVFSLKKTGRQLHFTLKDDGKGLPTLPQGSLGGNGLKNMAARAEALGADFLINNGVDCGTFVALKIPMK
jgi:signal transduction histidine kinase/ligand-binding sensor domain-containing protein